MGDSDNNDTDSYTFLNLNQENSPYNGTQNISKTVIKRKRKKHKYKNNEQSTVTFCLSRFSKSEKQTSFARHSSMPEINKRISSHRPRNRSGHALEQINKYRQPPFPSRYIVNVVSEHRFDNHLKPFRYGSQTKWKIYRCQLGGNVEDSCCCSCNSDAMFEVMKGLYDCYKKKNCDNCNCILCGQLTKEDKMLGDKRKSLAVSGVDKKAQDKLYANKIRAAKADGLMTPLKGKTPEQREKVLKGLAMRGLPLPEAQSPSEKKIIDKVRADLGIPIEPTTSAMRDKHEKAARAGLLEPLEGKTPAQKEKILQGLHDMGISLPEGRTPSEKALIAKVAGTPSRGAEPSPLKGKTPEQKEKILKDLAMKGKPLPEAQTPSEKKIIDKVRADLGIPAEPQTQDMKDKHDKAAKAGLLVPLEGKTPAQKEKILQGLHDMGIPLPEGRTPSEKALVAKVAATPPRGAEPSPLKGKTPEQKEKILKDLAMKGKPLPEAQSPSEKKIIDKVRANLGIPAEPQTQEMKEKHDKAAKAGLLVPLEGKTPAQKEKILQGLQDMGIPLPEGRTPSEKALVAKVKARPLAASIKSAILSPSEKLRKAKAEGLLTPLKGKTPEQKEKILRGRAMGGIPLPEGETPSEKKLIDKVRADLGMPAEPKTKAMKDKHDKAAKAGLLVPLEGKTPAQKEKILQGLHDMGIPLPEGRTPSEKALVAKVAATPPRGAEPSPLKGKTPEQKEKILKDLAKKGKPLPEPQSPSEKQIIDKVRAELGIPAEPKTKSMKEKYDKAAKAGLLTPLEGKTPAQKEKILQGLQDMGIPLPEGRTPSEKAIVAKVKAGPKMASIRSAMLSPSEKLRRAKAEGLMTPLKGKTPEQKEKILRGRAMGGIPLPEGETPSEKKLIDKVRADLGMPAEPKTKAMKDKHDKAAKAGLLVPLEGKTPAQKEKILQGLQDMGIPLPEGRTPSEKALVAKVKARPLAASIKSAMLSPSEKLRKAKAEGLMTPLKGKTPEQKEKILRGRAMGGIPLPEGETPSEKKLIDKVRADLGMPAEPKTKAMKDKHDKAAKAGLLVPLEGKTPAQKEKILQGLQDMGIPLPEGRTPSEKALVAKVKARPHAASIKSTMLSPSEKLRRAKVECECRVSGASRVSGLMTPLKGKTPEQKEKILKEQAMQGLPLPEGQTPSEKKLIDKVRADLGIPAEPKTKAMKEKHEKAAKAGLLVPLEGKTPAEKEKILQGLHDMGIPLPEGRTPSEKAIVAKVKAGPKAASIRSAMLSPSENLRRAKAEGLMTPLKGKTPEQKEKILRGRAMRGIPLPEGQTPSEKKIIDKVRADLGIPAEPKTKTMKEKHEKAAKAGLLVPLEGKTPAQKEKILQGLHDMGIPLPEGRTPSEKALVAKVKAGPKAASIRSAMVSPSENLRRAKAEGLMTPLKGKTPEQKEKILKGRAMRGIPLPEGQTPSEKKLIDKVRADLGIPAEPKTKDMKEKHEKAAKAGLLVPLEGKTPAQKEKILQGLQDMGIPLPEGRTPSEKALVAKVKGGPKVASIRSAMLSPSENLRRAKVEGLMTPLKGKTPEQKEKILKGRAMRGIPLPEGQTPSEKKLIDKVRADLGIPAEPKTKAMKEKHEKAAKAGLLVPLEGKTPAQKEKILQGLQDMGIPLPEGRTPSEKALVAKVKAGPKAASIRSAMVSPSENLRQAKAEGLMTPLKGKTPEQKEKILKGRAMRGIPLPEGQTPSEKKLIDKVRTDLGIPAEPKTKAMKEKHEKAAKAGLLVPLEGKTPAQKEKILQGLQDMGIPLPEGRTPSEKALVAKVKGGPKVASIRSAMLSPSENLRRAKAEGLMTPLKGKTPEQKEKILKGRAMRGIPLPEGQTASEKKLIDKVRADLGIPAEPKTKDMKEKHEKAAKAGLLVPLEGKTPEEKEKILKGLKNMGIPLPQGRTPSEKALVAKVKAEARAASIRSSMAAVAPSEVLRKAKAEGLLTPLKGKTPEQKEKILKGLAMKGIPLPEGQTASEKKLIDKVRADLGVPAEAKTKDMKEKHKKAAKAGLLVPLEGKTPEEKEKILKGLQNMGIPLPEGRTPSEKALVAKVKAESRAASTKSSMAVAAPSGALRKAKAEGLLTPLKGKTPEQKEKILKGLAMKGITLPEGQTASEKKLIDKVRADLGLPAEAKTKDMKEKHNKAAKAGLLIPLEGKTPAEKEKILQSLQEMGIPLPVGRTPSEKSLIAKIEAGKGVKPSSAERFQKTGLLTPITGKPPAEKERILRGLAEAGLPLPKGTTASEKALIKKIQDEVTVKKKAAKAVGVPAASKKVQGIEAPEYHEIMKTTKCDRGCGCDKKKIRFKHSYVKIRVTSPDISSLCPCPDDCLPGVTKGQTAIQKEGIEVIVGTVVGTPSYSKELIIDNNNSFTIENVANNTDHSNTLAIHTDNRHKDSETDASTKKVDTRILNMSILNTSNSDLSITRPYSENVYLQSSTPPYEGRVRRGDRSIATLRGFLSSGDSLRGAGSKTKWSESSLDSIFVIKSETSLSLDTSTNDSKSSTSVLLDTDSSITSMSTHYSGHDSTDYLLSISSLYGPTSDSDDLTYRPATFGNHRTIRNIEAAGQKRDYTVLRMSQTTTNFEKIQQETESAASGQVVLFNHLPSKLDISKILDKIMTKKRFTRASSIFIVVPMSDDEAEVASTCVDSNISIQTSETRLIDNDVVANPTLSVTPLTEHKPCGRGIKFYLQEVLSTKDTEAKFRKESLEVLRHVKMETKNKYCQIPIPASIGKPQINIPPTIQPEETSQNLVSTGAGIDTTIDRPCCCSFNESSSFINPDSKDQCVANVTSKLTSPLFLKGTSSGWLSITGNRRPSELLRVNPTYSGFDCCFPPCDLSQEHHHHHNHNHLHHQRRKHVRLHASETSTPCGCNRLTDEPWTSRSIKAIKSFGILIGGVMSKSTLKKRGSRKSLPSNTRICSNTSCSNLSDNDGGSDKKEQCPCQVYHRSISQNEPGPTWTSRSQAMLTDLTGADIQHLQRRIHKLKMKSMTPGNQQASPQFVQNPRRLNKQKNKGTASKVSCACQYLEEGPEDIVSAQVVSARSTKQNQTSFPSPPWSAQPTQPVPQKLSSPKSSKKPKFLSNLKRSLSLKSTRVPKDPKSPKTNKKTKKPKTFENIDDEMPVESQDTQLQQVIRSREMQISQQSMTNPQPIQQRPEQKHHPPGVTPAGYPIGAPNCMWEETPEMKKIRSELSRSTTGFQLAKKIGRPKSQIQVGKKSKEDGDIPLDFGDAVRYFASMNPVKFRMLMQDVLDEQKQAEEEEKKKNQKRESQLMKQFKEAKNKMRKEKEKSSSEDSNKDIENASGALDPCGPPIPYEYCYPPGPIESEETPSSSEDSEDKYPEGLKISLAGYSEMDCYNMTYEPYTPW